MTMIRFFGLALFVCVVAACTPREQAPRPLGKLQVVATLFPLYDMARAIAGDHADVTLLLPPGMDAHSFEPRPRDILRINGADLFIYTGGVMEPWAASLVSRADNRRSLVIDASSGIVLGAGHQHDDVKAGDRHGEGLDPHIWLDFDNARTMVMTILKGFEIKDPTNAATFRRNAEAYQARLEELDRKYREGLAACGSRIVIHGGHFAFGYLAKRYGLQYISTLPPTGDTEPNARQMAEMVDLIRKTGAHAVFLEELVSPRLAETLAREAGVKLLRLNAAHNVSKDELVQGATFPLLAERNLEVLREGLQCR